MLAPQTVSMSSAPRPWTLPKPPDNCSEMIKAVAVPPLSGDVVRPNFAMTRMAMPTTGISVEECARVVMSLNLPKEFTWRTFGQDQVEAVGSRDQRLCGGCWAFAIASSVGDRFALANQIKAPYPSSAWLISAGIKIDTYAGWTPVEGCAGNNVYNAAKWLGENKIPLKLESCWPFTVISASKMYGGPGEVDVGSQKEYVAPTFLGDDSYKGCCLNCCGPKMADEASFDILIRPAKSADGSVINTKYYGVINEKLPDGGKYTQNAIDLIIKDIQMNILADGPVTTSIQVYSDFQQFWLNDAKTGAIYKHKPSLDKPGGHAVVIVGWGEQNGERYWEIRNSWGSNTGGWEGGYMKIAMSSMSNLDSWIGVDVPLYDRTNQAYYCGVVSLRPEEVKKEALEKGIKMGLLKKSTAGNLLQKSRALIGDFTRVINSCPNFKGYTLDAGGESKVTPDDGPLPTVQPVKKAEIKSKWWIWVILAILTIAIVIVTILLLSKK